MLIYWWLIFIAGIFANAYLFITSIAVHSDNQAESLGLHALLFFFNESFPFPSLPP